MKLVLAGVLFGFGLILSFLLPIASEKFITWYDSRKNK